MSEIRAGGRYRVLGVAGRGGMAVVYRAVTEGSEGFARPVALKRLLPAVSRSPDGVKMFVEEARVSARLDHPHIVHVHDFGRHRDGGHFLVLEWVEGLDLGTWVRALPLGRPDWGVVGAIALDVLDALDYAHRHVDDHGEPAPIFHRDVSPGNVLIGLHGHAKLADFGLARAMDRATMTGRGILKGKVSYTAPEFLLGASPGVGTDLFSLGVTFWEALTAQKLFTADTDAEVLRKIARDPIPDVRDVRRDLPPSVAAVIQSALARDPAERPASARAMRRALLEALVEAGRLPDPIEVGQSVAEVRSGLGQDHRLDAAVRPPSDAVPAATASLEMDLDALMPPEESSAQPIPLGEPASIPFELIPFEELPED